MSRISFREDGEEHNFWQNYTDLTHIAVTRHVTP
jgi:hypothetical protein